MNKTKHHFALFGGSFNPIHKGHVRIVQELLKTKVDQVVVLPTGCSPFKSVNSLIHQEIRWKMVKRVFSGWERVFVSDLEIRTAEVSYTVDTLKKLKLQFPQCEHWYVVIGSDAYAHFAQWKNAKHLLEEATLWVIGRTSESEDNEDFPLTPLKSLFPDHALHWDAEQRHVSLQQTFQQEIQCREIVRFLDFQTPAISSSDIRSGQSEVGWIPECARPLYLSIMSRKSRLF